MSILIETTPTGRIQIRHPVALERLQRYAMMRYYAAWTSRRLTAAERWFNAAERASRQLRVMAYDTVSQRQYSRHVYPNVA